MLRGTRHRIIPESPRSVEDRTADGMFRDFYLYLLTCSWPLLLLQIAVAFFAANALFALGYFLDGGIEGARPGSFSDIYFFSVETMATVGYGKMAPVTFVSHLLMSIEALTGLLAFAMVTGLIFAKFSRPTARVRFSRFAVVSQREGVPSLMFRMANARANPIVETQVHVTLTRMEKTVHGEERRFYDLALERSSAAAFVYAWTPVHRIVPGTPLFGATAESLAAADAWITVSLTGLDESFSQTVYARTFYTPEDIRWGARLVNIMGRSADGRVVLDFARV